MSKPTSAVKDRYNQKAYDRITIYVQKGHKEVIKEQASKKGFVANGSPSINGYINSLIEEDLK